MNRFAIENLFGIQGLNIAWYGVIIAGGLLLGVLLGTLRARKRGWSADVVLDFILLAVPLAVIGARLTTSHSSGISTRAIPQRFSPSTRADLPSTAR